LIVAKPMHVRSDDSLKWKCVKCEMIHVLRRVLHVEQELPTLLMLTFSWKLTNYFILKKKFEDTKGAIRAINRRRTHNAMAKRKSTKEQTTIYKRLQRKQKIEKHEPHWKPGVNSGVPEGSVVPAPHVAPVLKHVSFHISHTFTSVFCTFSFGHCVVCPSSIYSSDCPFGIFKLFFQYKIVCQFSRER
jgi:hypothetical protein